MARWMNRIVMKIDIKYLLLFFPFVIKMYVYSFSFSFFFRI